MSSIQINNINAYISGVVFGRVEHLTYSTILRNGVIRGSISFLSINEDKLKEARIKNLQTTDQKILMRQHAGLFPKFRIVALGTCDGVNCTMSIGACHITESGLDTEVRLSDATPSILYDFKAKSLSEWAELEEIVQEDNHEGMVYNPYTDNWSWF